MKRKIVLIASLVAGVIAAVLTRFYAIAKEAEVRDRKAALLARYGDLMAELSPRFYQEMYNNGPGEGKRQADASELAEIIRGLSAALADYDLDTVGDCLAKLEGLQLSEAQQALLQKLKQAQEEYDYDTLEQLLAAWQS